MNQQQINLVRDAAVSLEENNLQMAHDLMALAYENRPNGLFIQQKLEAYKQELKPSKKLKELFEKGELAIIPAGFRCDTKMNIFKNLGLEQASLPFDSGFFSPYAVASVLENKKIKLDYPEANAESSHNVCIKLENQASDKLGKGIKFQKSTYDEIDFLAKNKKQADINKYLDSTFGYYTLDNKNKFVLAHYNWHSFADVEKSKGIYDLKTNLSNINITLNKRIERMFEICEKAKYIIFVFGEFQNYKYMEIDNDIYELDNFEILSEKAKNIFGDKCLVTNFSQINTAKKLLRKIKVDSE